MFNIGGGEVLMILFVALMVLGPDKLPNAARQAGKYMAEFRRMSQGFQQEVRQAMAEVKTVETSNGPTLPPLTQATPAPGKGMGDGNDTSATATSHENPTSDEPTEFASSEPVALAPTLHEPLDSFTVDGPTTSFS